MQIKVEYVYEIRGKFHLAQLKQIFDEKTVKEMNREMIFENFKIKASEFRYEQIPECQDAGKNFYGEIIQ